MQHQYLVNVRGSVLDTNNRSYVVRAETELEAQKIACQNFNQEFECVNGTVYSHSQKRNLKAVIAILLLIVPIFLSFISWKNGHNSISIRPNLVSSLFAITLYSAYVVRFKGIQRTIQSFVDVFLCLQIILLFSSFTEVLLYTKTIDLKLVEISIDSKIVLTIAIIMSWFGLKLVSVLCLSGVGILSLVRITELNEAMGSLWGTLYIVCAFFGILFYLSIEPAVNEMSMAIKKGVYKGKVFAKDDFEVLKKAVKPLDNESKLEIEERKNPEEKDLVEK